MESTQNNLTLGLDIGANSIGWTLMDYDDEWTRVELIDIGLRVFEAGVEGDLESGNEKSKAVDRREARLTRRGLDRKARRLSKIYKLLSDHKLLPPIKLDESEKTSPHTEYPQTRSLKKRQRRFVRTTSRHSLLSEFDAHLIESWRIKLLNEGESRGKVDQISIKFPYFLRAKALSEELTPYEIGRCFYHLSQRRGFLSNRKAPMKKGEDEGQVKTAIKELREEMSERNARTLGEFFSMEDPTVKRIRKRWTARDMYEAEFELIYETQRKFHPELLTDELKKKLHKAIFHQRPLKSQKGKIGKCELERDRRRAPLAILEVQRFRAIQMLLNLRVRVPGEMERPLTPEERNILFDELEFLEKMSFSAAKKKLGLTKKGTKFSIEEGGEKDLIGNKTSARLFQIFGDRWKNFSDEEKSRVIDDVRSIQKQDTLYRRGINHWKLDEESARKLSELSLEEDYAKLSRKAINKLLPLMMSGVHYATAVKEIYGDRMSDEVSELLPPLVDVMGDIRNPAVQRSLSELRKIINAIIRKYGKPARIHIELARDLKRSKKQRTDLSKQNRANEKKRQDARERIIKATNIGNPSGTDILKVMLADECNWMCPYTGRTIDMDSLFGPHAQFDIEHIVPFSRCFDNSFLNKTLCYHEENRNVKRNNTPFEAYRSNPEKYSQILDRVWNFKGDARDKKYEKFLAEKIEGLDEFTTRQLNDTRYASKLAAQYLSVLYGKESLKRIQVSTGQITAYVRDELGLNSVLGDGGTKERTDHRHHAIDAVAIALINKSLIKRMADASERAWERGRIRFAPDKFDTSEFLAQVKRKADGIVVSHRVERGINGPLHKETNYKPGPVDKKTGKPTWRARTSLDSLKASEVEKIVDPWVRDIVKYQIEKLGGGDPAKIFSDENNLPWFIDKDGEIHHRIRTVTVERSENPFSVGEGDSARHVVHKSNHHIEVLETTDKKGNIKWEGVMVSSYEALKRKQRKRPVVQKDHGEGKKFVCSLACTETFEIDTDSGKRELFKVRGISETKTGQISVEFVRLNDARKQLEIKAAKCWFARGIEPLRKLNFKKKIVTPLGEVRNAVD